MKKYMVVTLTGVAKGAVFASCLENAIVTAEELFGAWRLVFPLGGQSD